MTETAVYVVSVTLTDIVGPHPVIFEEQHRTRRVAYRRAQQYVLEGYRRFGEDGVSFTLIPPRRISHVEVRLVEEEAPE